MKRIAYDQSQRQHVYCDGEEHLTITDPHSPYSGDEHRLEFSECDCAAHVTPSTPTGEDENDGQSYGGTDPSESA